MYPNQHHLSHDTHVHVALFPGPTQLSVACSMVKRRKAGRGNEANVHVQCTVESVCVDAIVVSLLCSKPYSLRVLGFRKFQRFLGLSVLQNPRPSGILYTAE